MRSHLEGRDWVELGMPWRVAALRYFASEFGKATAGQACFSGDMAGSRECCPPKPSISQVSFVSCHHAHPASSACLNAHEAGTPSSLASWFCSEASGLLAGFENTK